MTAVAVSEGIDAGVAWHFGDPLREQRLLSSSAGVVDRSNRGVLIVPGEDRLSWLHSICSQHVSGLADGDSTEALVLSPHGHVEQHWQVTELGGQLWLDVEPGMAADALGYLEKMKFLKRVEPQDVTADWAVVSVVGPLAGEFLVAAGFPTPDAGRAVGRDGGGFVRAMAWGFDLLVPRAEAERSVDALLAAGASRAGIWAFEALRVESRRPRLRFESDHRTIPHEVGWIGSAVHLDKGCYRGQETVARVQNLGKPPRRLVLLHLSGASDTLPEPGTPIESQGRAVGFLGTAVHHHELGPIALAVIKRSLPDDASLTVAGDPVTID